MKIAVPWSLSEYIPLNGFHPLYRALFDHAPADISLIAWDNVKLDQHFRHNLRDRERLLRLATSYQRERARISAASIADLSANTLYPPDRILTEALCGEVEFYHTAPLPSLTRPFVLHCERFAPVFFRCAPQGRDQFGDTEQLRPPYLQLLANPLCLGIYSHIPETLERISSFFSDAAIDAKLFGSKIGLSKRSVDAGAFRPRQRDHKPRFLFMTARDRTAEGFIDRGGHVVLRFWKEFRSAGRDGMLILQGRRPDDSTLASYGVDPAFIRHELGRSILWAEGHLANHEMNSLMADAHFLLLPGASLDAASILLAMTLGTVPIVTDTPGTDVYVTDRQHAIVLTGVRDAISHLDPGIGVCVGHGPRISDIAASLVKQLVQRVFETLDSEEALLALSHRTAEWARVNFSGETFAADFWHSITAKARQSRARGTPVCKVAELAASLQNCTLDQSAWSRVFESSPQPRPLLDTGTGTVAELGGAVVHVAGRPPSNPADWSVFARYYSPNAPVTTFAKTLVDLDDVSLSGNGQVPGLGSKHWIRAISTSLMRFPRVHALASRSYRIASKAWVLPRTWPIHFVM